MWSGGCLMSEAPDRRGIDPRFFEEGPTLEIGHPVFMNYRREEVHPPFEMMEEMISRLESIEAEGKSLPENPEWARKALRSIYEMVDQLGEAIAPGMSCEAGCAACCRVMVSTSSVEAALIGDRLSSEPPDRREKWMELVRSRNARLSELSGRTDPPADLSTFEGLLATCEDWEKENLPCPFLGEGNLCSIYEDRHLLCRVCWVLTDPEDCSPGAGPPVKFRTKFFEKAYFVVSDISVRHMKNGSVSPIPWWLEPH